jgi:arylsulfatase A-like enzyme
MNRPNFLFFITDQQPYTHLGCYGNTVLKTPHIDTLAQQGSRLEHFYVAAPVCMPNRASLMTGRMPSLHGVRHNGINLDLQANTFIHLFRAAGYRTALIGKSHLQNFTSMKPGYPPPTIAQGLQAPPGSLTEARMQGFLDSDYEVENEERWEQQADHQVPLPYYGFDYVKLCTDHGDRVGGEYRRWLKERATLDQIPGPEHALLRSGLNPQLYQTAVPEHLHPTWYVAQETANYLEDHARGHQTRPFFVQCSFPDPHHPFTPPGKYWEMYDPADISLPASFYSSSHDQIPPLAHLYQQHLQGLAPQRWTSPFIASEEAAREIVAKTYGMVSFIDAAVGHVLERLERLGLWNNTVIVFTSDHGDWMGAHGLFLKGPLHYQNLIRVPFIWLDPDPRYNTGAQKALGNTLDIGRTLLARAKLAPYNGHQGMDLLGVLAGESKGNADILVEQTTQYHYLGFDRLVRVYSYLNSQYRLSVWEGCEWGELYDLNADPDELNNLWGNSTQAGLRSALLHKMVQKMQALGDQSPYPSRVA